MFDIQAHYHRAVATNLALWRHRLLEDKEPNRWQAQHDAAWQAIAAGLSITVVQPAAARLAIDLNPLMEQWGVWVDWLPLLETAVALGFPVRLQAELLLVKGRIYFLNRSFNDAIRVQTTALTLFTAEQQTTLMAHAHYHLANTYWGSKACEQAQQHGIQALNLLPPNQNVWLAKIHNTLGLVELEMGNFTASEQQFKQAIAYWQLLDEPTFLARSWLNLSITYQRQKQLPAARTCYEQAYTLLRDSSSIIDNLNTLNILGILHHEAEDFAEAEEVFRHGVLTTQQVSGMFHVRGSLTHNLGNTLLALQRWEEAKLYLEKSIWLWRHINDTLEEANSLGTLAELYEKQGEWATAVAHYDQALQLLIAYPQNQWAQKIAKNFHAGKTKCAAHG